MYSGATSLRRKSLALALAYLLALQAILIAWTVVPPTIAGLPKIQASLCGGHSDGSTPSDQAPGGCPCGALCLSCACATPAVSAPELAYHAIVWVQHRVARPALPESRIVWRRDRFDPLQARAPPAMA
jgi:hypothetical protein